MDLNQLIKNRSIKSCIREGYRLYANNVFLLLRHSWKMLLLMGLFLTVVLYEALSLALNLSGSRAVSAVLLIVFGLLAIAAQIRMKTRLLDLLGPKPTLKKAVRRLCRHLGNYLSMLLISGLVCLVVFAFVCLPLLILCYAVIGNSQSMSMGEPNQLRAGFWILAFVTSTLTFALLGFIQLWQTLASCFVYGSYIAKEQKK